jgi:hypothetical protein
MSSKVVTFSVVLNGLLVALAIGDTPSAWPAASESSGDAGAASAAPAPAAIAARMKTRRLT